MPLTVEDFGNWMFDGQPPRRRRVESELVAGSRDIVADMVEDGFSDEMAEDWVLDGLEADGEPLERWCIEGTTTTNEWVPVGYTYWEDTGMLTIKNTDNVLLFEGVIHAAEDFEAALKKAERKHYSL